MRALAPFVAATLLALAGCTSTTDSPPEPKVTTSSPSPSQIELTEAQLLGRWGADPSATQGRPAPWLRFDYDGKIAGFDGCNEVGGT